MSKDYKVWLDVEEYDDETDEYRNCDLGFAGTARFDTEVEGHQFAELLDQIGNIIVANIRYRGDPAVPTEALLAGIGDAIDDWRQLRRRADASTVTGLSPDKIIIDDSEVEDEVGDANNRT